MIFIYYSPKDFTQLTLPRVPHFYFMYNYFSKEEALRKLKNQGITWLALTDIQPSQDDNDIYYWECLPSLDISKRGTDWQYAELIDSPNGISILESALSIPSRTLVYFNNRLIQKK